MNLKFIIFFISLLVFGCATHENTNKVKKSKTAAQLKEASDFIEFHKRGSYENLHFALKKIKDSHITYYSDYELFEKLIHRLNIKYDLDVLLIDSDNKKILKAFTKNYSFDPEHFSQKTFVTIIRKLKNSVELFMSQNNINIPFELFIIRNILTSLETTSEMMKTKNYLPGDAGIGVSVAPSKDGYFVFQSIVVNSPAKEAGLKKNDRIIEIDSLSTKYLTAGELASLINGNENTTVELLIQRSNEMLKFIIKRKKYRGADFSFDIIDDDIGYLKVNTFSFNSSKEIKQELLSNSDNFDKLIIDIRDNSGGRLNEITDFCDLFILKDTAICEVVGRFSEINRIIYAKNDDLLSDKKLIIVSNNQTASGAIIIGNVIKENQRGMIIGDYVSDQIYIDTLYLFKTPENFVLRLSSNEIMPITGKTRIVPDIVIDNLHENVIKRAIAELNK